MTTFKIDRVYLRRHWRHLVVLTPCALVLLWIVVDLVRTFDHPGTKFGLAIGLLALILELPRLLGQALAAWMRKDNQTH